MKWSLLPPASPETLASLSAYPKAVATLLARRSIVTPEEAEAFLSPRYETGIHDPFLLTQMRAACARLLSAFKKGEKIVIHSDYDADGLGSAALLLSAFRQIVAAMSAGPEISAYHPHREKDGYGIREATIERFASEGITLMVTTDCGISCAAEIGRAKELGIDTIVVDHHEFPATLPDAILLHPRLPGETYPFKFLSAGGVAFKLASALFVAAREEGVAIDPGAEKWLLDLAAITTVTDVMPLVGENRVIEKFGLVVLNKTKRPGLRKIIETAGMALGSLDTTSIGYYIGPRINAASRMEHASTAFAALTATTDDEALVWAEKLQQLNKDRQKYTEQILAAARAEAAAHPDSLVHIIKGEGWSAGIVGLVAGRIVNDTGKPVFVFGQEGEKIVGSGRGIPGYNVVEAMERGKDALLRYGGHPQACGLTIMGDANFARFKEAAEAYAEEKLAGRDLEPLLPIDAELQASELTEAFARQLGQLEPFGEANPRPKFLLKNAMVSGISFVGKTKKHVQMLVRGDSPREVKLIGFNMADAVADLGLRSRVDAVLEVSLGEWNGLPQVEARIVDIAPAGEKEIAAQTTAPAEASSDDIVLEPLPA